MARPDWAPGVAALNAVRDALKASEDFASVAPIEDDEVISLTFIRDKTEYWITVERA